MQNIFNPAKIGLWTGKFCRIQGSRRFYIGCDTIQFYIDSIKSQYGTGHDGKYNCVEGFNHRNIVELLCDESIYGGGSACRCCEFPLWTRLRNWWSCIGFPRSCWNSLYRLKCHFQPFVETSRRESSQI